MDKLFIDDVIDFAKKHKRQPGPFEYEPLKTFNGSGKMYTMRAKMDRYGEKDENYSKNYLER